jgi:hypothetical protein
MEATEQPASENQPLVVGDKKELGANPHPVYMSGRPVVMYSVQDGDLVTIGALSLVGATSFTLLGYFLSSYQSYSIALRTTTGLDIQTISDYRLYVWGSKIGLVVFGFAALLSGISVWRKIRKIKKHGELYIWSEGKLIRAEDPNKNALGLWQRLWAKI